MNVEALNEALTLVFTVETMFWLVAGVFLGVGPPPPLGAIPGLTASTGIALVLPPEFPSRHHRDARAPDPVFLQGRGFRRVDIGDQFRDTGLARQRGHGL